MSSSLFDPYGVTHNPKRCQYNGQVLRRKRVNKKEGCYTKADLKKAFQVLKTYNIPYYPFIPFTYPFTSKTIIPFHFSNSGFPTSINISFFTNYLISHSLVPSLPYNHSNYDIYLKFVINSYSYSLHVWAEDWDISSYLDYSLSGSINPSSNPVIIPVYDNKILHYKYPFLYFYPSDQNHSFNVFLDNNDSIQHFFSLDCDICDPNQNIFYYVPQGPVLTSILDLLSIGQSLPSDDPANISLLDLDFSYNNLHYMAGMSFVSASLGIEVITHSGQPYFF